MIKPNNQDSLSSLLARRTILITVSLGIFFSIIQISLDLSTEKKEFHKQVNDIVLLIKDSATQAAYNIDLDLAEKTITGLKSNLAFKNIKIEDEKGNILAEHKSTFDYSNLNFIVALTFKRKHHYQYPLQITQNQITTSVGALIIDVDSLPFVSDFISRSNTTLISGLIRNVILGLLLLILFKRLLVNPLQKITSELYLLDPENPNQKGINTFNTSHKNELSGLIIVINKLYSSAQNSISKTKKHDKAKQEILNILSHELRTPLNSVMGHLDILNEFLEGSNAELLQGAKDATSNLISLLHRTLTFNELNSNCYKLNLEKKRFITLINKMQYSFPNIKIIYAENDKNYILEIDLALTSQLIEELLTNAIKFTNLDTTYCEIAIIETGKLNITVIDAGPGVPANRKSEITKLFSQGEQGFNRTHQGLGIGLPICKLAAKRMGGEINLADNELGGTTFTASLPLTLYKNEENCVADSPHQTDLTSKKIRYDKLSGTKILLVEDNIINQTIESKMLHKIGCHVTIASNGLEALKKLDNGTFDLILMDCQMPIMNGFETTVAIRQSDNKNNNKPIIAVTANALSGDRETCLSSGMNDYMTKPVNVDSLKKMIYRWL